MLSHEWVIRASILIWVRIRKGLLIFRKDTEVTEKVRLFKRLIDSAFYYQRFALFLSNFSKLFYLSYLFFIFEEHQIEEN